MIWDTQRACRATLAICPGFVLAPVHDIVMAWIAEVVAALSADKLADRAAVHALEVNELISMLCAHVFAEADFLPGA